MKKTLLMLGLLATTVSAETYQFKSLSFLNEASVRSLVVSNLTSAPLGGFTNILSWGYPGIQTTNPAFGIWTNANGTRVVPTNNSALATDPVGTHFVYGDTTQLFLDVPLWVSGNGLAPFTLVTNSPTALWTDQITYSPMSVSMSYIGGASVSGTMNLVFIGIPDGTNEPNNAVSLPTWQWGATTAVGAGTITTNFPVWRFLGCKTVRVKSITGVAAAAASDFTITSLKLNGYVP